MLSKRIREALEKDKIYSNTEKGEYYYLELLIKQIEKIESNSYKELCDLWDIDPPDGLHNLIK